MELNSNFRQCPNGHWYDASASAACPQCAAAGRGQWMEDYGVTEPIPAFGTASIRKAGSSGMEEYGQPGFLSGSGGGERGASAYGAVQQFGSSGEEDMEAYGPTMPVASRAGAGFSPVTGWLVCIEGADRGRDYRIHTGYNRMGRADHMDICIAGDPSISRERHALIAYDPEEKVFFFGPDEGRSLVRLNGKLVMTPSELHAYDVITLGETRLLFIPLCGERFNWDE